MAGTGEYTIADLAELFSVSRTTVYAPSNAMQRQNADRRNSHRRGLVCTW
jgi:hypothetical protein